VTCDSCAANAPDVNLLPAAVAERRVNVWTPCKYGVTLSPSGRTGLRPLADGRTPDPLRLLLVLLPPLLLLCALGPSRAVVMAVMAALNSYARQTAPLESTVQRCTTLYPVSTCNSLEGGWQPPSQHTMQEPGS
jgi:hypothetical protein